MDCDLSTGLLYLTFDSWGRNDGRVILGSLLCTRLFGCHSMLRNILKDGSKGD